MILLQNNKNNNKQIVFEKIISFEKEETKHVETDLHYDIVFNCGTVKFRWQFETANERDMIYAYIENMYEVKKISLIK